MKTKILNPNSGDYTTAPVQISQPEKKDPILPEYIRPPRNGERDPIVGLGRSKLYELCVPSRANGFNPPVKSICLRKKGAKTGARLISVASLLEYVNALGHEQEGVNNETA
ncbi:MAG: hypothetical protein WCD79_14755 [Chthoniobacteraceae bacterium]